MLGTVVGLRGELQARQTGSSWSSLPRGESDTRPMESRNSGRKVPEEPRGCSRAGRGLGLEKQEAWGRGGRVCREISRRRNPWEPEARRHRIQSFSEDRREAVWLSCQKQVTKSAERLGKGCQDGWHRGNLPGSGICPEVSLTGQSQICLIKNSLCPPFGGLLAGGMHASVWKLRLGGGCTTPGERAWSEVGEMKLSVVHMGTTRVCTSEVQGPGGVSGWKRSCVETCITWRNLLDG